MSRVPQTRRDEVVPMTTVPTGEGESQQTARHVASEQRGMAQSMVTAGSRISTDATGKMAQAHRVMTQNVAALG
ncbi:hypothetical protein, partial [Staphylococcus pseudintermedius]|uniref:hypothetical protein n=1 Tax=Staphylococcus pseudintermedius TaxID=283734 RepID=UPI0015E8682E